MSRSWRWFLAGVLTVVIFLVVTWMVTKYLPTSWLKDSNKRLAVGCGAGTAAAALVALWGNAFATTIPDKSAAAEPEQGSPRAVVVGGNNTGIVTAGDRTRNTQRTGSVAHVAPQRSGTSGDATGESETAGTWVRIGGNNDGIASAGNDTTNTQNAS